MKNPTEVINDSWILTRTGHFSNSFSNFLSKIGANLPEKDREKMARGLEGAQKEMEKATKSLQSMDKLKDIPFWLKPFAERIVKQVTETVSSSLSQVASELFGAGIFSLSEALYDVAKERGVRHEGTLRLIRMLPEFEALMYFLNVRKFYRDHCAHQLRVAVLGDFLLDLESHAGGMEGIIKDKLEFSSDEVRSAWWFAGLLHDTGVPLSKLGTAVNWSLLNEILRCYPSLDIKAVPMFIDLAGNDLSNVEYLSVLTDGMPESWQRMLKEGLGAPASSEGPRLFKAGYCLKEEYQPVNVRMDHGVVGAVNLLRTLGTPERLRKDLPEDRPLIEAAKAISLHNYKDMLRTVPFEGYPLAFLLVLTDELQEWSRPVPVPVKDTYFTTNIEKVALLDRIFYSRPEELWEILYTNAEAKRLSAFDFKRLCKDKETALTVLDCTDQFPESEVELRNMEGDELRKGQSFNVEITTK